MYLILQCKFPCKGIAAIADDAVEACAKMVTLQFQIFQLDFVVDGDVLPVLGVFLLENSAPHQ